MHWLMMAGTVNCHEISPWPANTAAHCSKRISQIGSFAIDSQQALLRIQLRADFGQRTVDCGTMLADQCRIVRRQRADLPSADPERASSVADRLNFDPGCDRVSAVAGANRSGQLETKVPCFFLEFTQRWYSDWPWHFAAAIQLQRQQRLASRDQQPLGIGLRLG